MYSIDFTDYALDNLKKLNKQAQDRILSVLDRIKISPELYLKKIPGIPYYKLVIAGYILTIDLRKKILIIFVVEVSRQNK